MTVLIPAHDESALIARCVRSLRDQSYPRSLYRVVVIADNCTDDTAAQAAEAGADVVLARLEPRARGKGHALRWAMDRMIADHAVDAFVVVDADSIADREFLSRLVQPLRTGARAVQGESLLDAGADGDGSLRVSAFLLINRVRPAGRAVLGLPMTHLAGNGMLLTRELLCEKPWGAYTSAEDLEYSLDLQVDGIPIVYASGAVLLVTASAERARGGSSSSCAGRAASSTSPGRGCRASSRGRCASAGRRCWASPSTLPCLPSDGCRPRRSPAPWRPGSWHPLTPVALWTLTPWLIGLGSIPLFVLIGLRSAGAPPSAYRALLRAPLLVLGKPLGAATLLRFRGDTWVRTERGAPPSGAEGDA